MKILVFGSNSKWAIENAFLEYLRINNDIIFLNGHGSFLSYYHKNILNKIFFRMGLSTIFSKINKDLLKLTIMHKPDAIIVFKGMEIFPKTLMKINRIGIPLLNYNADHPFEYMSRGSGNKNVLNSIKYYQHHFSYSKKIVDQIKKKYNISASWLPFAYFQAHPPKNEILNSVCFIGNPDTERVCVIKLLLKNNIAVDLYGNNWDKFINSSENLKIHKPVYSNDFNKIAQQYRVQLNIFRPHNYDSHNMRTFEMPALGCIMLAPYSSEHISLFKENEEAFYYKNDKELIGKCKLILQLNEDEAFKIKTNAYNRSINSNYSYKDRSKQILNQIEKFL